MKAFFVGLLFLVAVMILTGVGVLLFPVFVLMAWFLRWILGLIFIIISIWLLGKFIIFVWQEINK